MDCRGRAHHARASATPPAGGSKTGETRHDTNPAVIQDRQWRQELENTRSFTNTAALPSGNWGE
jgi:hypothetical protein